MDVRLPGISGIQTSRRIVAELPGTVVVLLSTHRRPTCRRGWTTAARRRSHPRRTWTWMRWWRWWRLANPVSVAPGRSRYTDRPRRSRSQRYTDRPRRSRSQR